MKKDYVSVLQNATIKTIAEKLKRTSAQCILRYLIQRNIVVIPKSVTPARINSNYDVGIWLWHYIYKKKSFWKIIKY